MEMLDLIKREIDAANGFLPFDRYMQLALYAPAMGYYSSGVPMEQGGDFTTAPQMTPLFGGALARQLAQLFEAGVAPRVLEFGAGTGRLAHDVLAALAELGFADLQYQILELSASLQAQQQQTLANYSGNVRWLDALPAEFEGVMLGNEVLDAMPVKLFALAAGHTHGSVQLQIVERGVTWHGERLTWAQRAADSQLAAAVNTRLNAAHEGMSAYLAGVFSQNTLEKRMDTALPTFAYASEIGLQAEAFMRTLGGALKRGAVLMIDYGFPAHEFYHPQRAGGTLMCHTQHRSHSDPLHAPGREDITAHIDFSAMRDAALEGGLTLAGYTGQARFLMNCGLLDIAAQLHNRYEGNALAYAQAVAPLQKLLSEAEMGELFKVIGFSKGIALEWLGFARGDRSGAL